MKFINFHQQNKTSKEASAIREGKTYHNSQG